MLRRIYKQVSCYSAFSFFSHKQPRPRLLNNSSWSSMGDLTRSPTWRLRRQRWVGNFPQDLKKINDDDREVLEQFITEKLLEAEARESGIKVTEQDVSQYIDEIKKRNRLSDDELKTVLSREGQTLESYRASVKSELEKVRFSIGR